MSQFTKPLGAFHKSTAFDFPCAAHPPTPPDTDVDSFSTIHPPFFSPNLKTDANESFTLGGPADTPTSRPISRKASNLSYISSGITRVDQRFNSPRPAATRWLVVVSPPPALALENGSTMFLNPSRQESQSVLLPLFPSLSRQLSAVAREFSFPSTSGICLFLRLPEHGVPYSSRLSEESWSILWAHVLFEERPVPGSSTGGLPIAGRLEFDIDLRKARWYDAWITAIRREFESTPVSTAPSVHHGREDSRVTQLTDTVNDESEDLTISGQKRKNRHVPRKLSLIEKLDSNSSVRSLSRPASRQGHSPPHHETFPLHALSPIPQLDEPKSAIKVLESKVENWRASAVFSKSPLTHTEATLLPATIPSSEQAEEDEGQELNLDDFSWSISSAGPPSDVPWSALSTRDDVLSIDLGHRAEGSVCLTPSTCTSWGPADYSIHSPVSTISRLPSPDLAFREYEYVPLTPSTATSWGPPVDWEDYPLSAISSRVPSVDLAGRAMSSRPCTPSTATSWGPPLEWPDTPATPYRVHTPDVGQRSFAMDETAPWNHVWPYNEHHAPASDSNHPWQHVWPYGERKSRTSSESSTWKLVWPYRHELPTDDKNQASSSSHSGYPHFNLYPAVYPHFDLYPAIPEVGGSASDAGLLATYPRFNIYPAVYPFFEIYPGHVVAPQEVDELPSVKLPRVYPALDIYPAVYPVFEIYPGNVIDVRMEDAMTPLPVTLKAHYPAFDLYAAVYPNICIYPSVNIVEASVIKSPSEPVTFGPVIVGLPVSQDYPVIELYPAVYPHNVESIYPTRRADRSVARHAIEEVIQESSGPKSVSVMLEASYPMVEPYPPVYPYLRIYPDVQDLGNNNSDVIQANYPNFDLYPAVYPYFDIYKSGFATTPEVLEVGQIPLSATYPCFDIYPAVYPYFDIYSTGFPTLAEVEQLEAKPVALGPTYPRFNIYPAVYPYFDIYSTGFPTLVEVECGVGSVVLSASYPCLDIYPAVYPYFDIYCTGYPTLAENEREVEIGPIALESSYPNFNIYPAAYPYFDIYSSGYPTTGENEQRLEVGPIRLTPSYPKFNLYPPVYPSFDIYNQGSDSMTMDLGDRKTRQELHDAVMSNSKAVAVSRVGRTRKTHEDLYNEVATLRNFTLKIDTTPVSQNPTVRPVRSPPEARAVASSPFESNLSVKPSEIRRAGSLNHGATPPITPPLRRFSSMSDRTTAINHSRHGSTTRSPLATAEPITESSTSEESSPVRKRAATRRDSIVLEKARHWGAPGSQAPAPSAHFNSITVEDLSAFPMPPMPPLPTKPNSDLNRPIAKLDRSKLPFH
ncbi:hypothetical protein SCHPADRAFT_927057 [Schizopora paradoxa]|uniref:Uncharacterized protein n=1 Tax=Schizopora paradoxa TaxID=27342 RepID=A0A0H2RV23_9AGAM|nr:hypothetical protein SCHPADRAFT_927057 [Schizopora paradoxa]